MASAIEWTDNTWNPTTGCTRVSEGCARCYAFFHTLRLAAMGQVKYKGLVNARKRHFNGVLKIHPDTLAIPLQRLKATKWFVNSMSDLFHKDAPFSYIAAVFGVMACCQQHSFQILTKRPENMVTFFAWLDEQAHAAKMSQVSYCIEQARAYGVTHPRLVLPAQQAWPLPNVWLGVSVESQDYVGRIALLRQVPAAIRFLSCEPLLGPLDLRGLLGGIHWVIVGGESGAGARPMERDWVQQIKETCDAADVTFFLKQLGTFEAKRLGLDHKKGGNEVEWVDEWKEVGGRAFPV